MYELREDRMDLGRLSKRAVEQLALCENALTRLQGVGDQAKLEQGVEKSDKTRENAALVAGLVTRIKTRLRELDAITPAQREALIAARFTPEEVNAAFPIDANAPEAAVRTDEREQDGHPI